MSLNIELNNNHGSQSIPNPPATASKPSFFSKLCGIFKCCCCATESPIQATANIIGEPLEKNPKIAAIIQSHFQESEASKLPEDKKPNKLKIPEPREDSQKGKEIHPWDLVDLSDSDEEEEEEEIKQENKTDSSPTSKESLATTETNSSPAPSPTSQLSSPSPTSTNSSQDQVREEKKEEKTEMAKTSGDREPSLTIVGEEEISEFLETQLNCLGNGADLVALLDQFLPEEITSVDWKPLDSNTFQLIFYFAKPGKIADVKDTGFNQLQVQKRVTAIVSKKEKSVQFTQGIIVTKKNNGDLNLFKRGIIAASLAIFSKSIPKSLLDALNAWREQSCKSPFIVTLPHIGLSFAEDGKIKIGCAGTVDLEADKIKYDLPFAWSNETLPLITIPKLLT